MDTMFCCWCCFIRLISLIFTEVLSSQQNIIESTESPYTIPPYTPSVPCCQHLARQWSLFSSIFVSVPWFSFDRESMHVCEQQRGRGGGERILCCQDRAWCRTWSHELWDHDLSSDPDLDAEPTEPPRHPDNSGAFYMDTNSSFWGPVSNLH